MNAQDRQAIEDVFSRLEAVERQAGPRDGEAEAMIRERMRAQPGSAYYLAQTVVIQQQALENAQRRIQDLEQQGARAGAAGGARPATAQQAPSGAGAGAAGFGRSGFGRSAQPAAPAAPATGFGRSAGGGGFLAGAAQTALGVAGGMMLGGLLGSMFGGNSAQAAEPEAAQAPAEPADEGAVDEGGWDEGGMDDMDMGEF